MLLLFVGPIGVKLLDFFCSGIQLYLLLIPYLCFVSFEFLTLSFHPSHTGKCIRRFGGIYAYCRYFIDRKW